MRGSTIPMYAKPGMNPEHEHAVGRARVDLDDFRLGGMRKPGDVRQIGSEVVAIAHRHSNERVPSTLRGRRRGGGLFESADEPTVIGEQRIEVNGDGSIRRHDIPHAGNRRGSQRLGQLPRLAR